MRKSTRIGIALISLLTSCVTLLNCATPLDDRGPPKKPITKERKPMEATIAAAGTGGVNGEVMPAGNWTLDWAEEFDGTRLDTTTWATKTDAYADQCLGNKADNKLEYNVPENVTVNGGILTITAKREDRNGYTWTSGLITTGHSCDTIPAKRRIIKPNQYMSTRQKLPSVPGMWPAFWTWGGGTELGRNEVDAYEFHGDNPRLLELTNQSILNGGDTAHKDYTAAVDIGADWHVFSVYLGTSNVIWYLDGQEIFRGEGFSPNPEEPESAIITNLSIDNGKYHPPPTVNSAQMMVDWIRVYSGTPTAGGGPAPMTPMAPDSRLCECTAPGTPHPDCPPEPPQGCADAGTPPPPPNSRLCECTAPGTPYPDCPPEQPQGCGNAPQPPSSRLCECTAPGTPYPECPPEKPAGCP